MRKITAILGLLTLASVADAQTAIQPLTFEVTAIKELSVLVDSPNLNSTSVGTYAITVNSTESKIVGVLDVAMPANAKLTAHLGAVGGGTSAGTVTLDVTPTDLVIGIGPVASWAPLVLTLSAPVGTQVTAPTVTYTIVTIQK